MTVLRIEHKVPNFESWKKAFDSDPVDRRNSGVRRYRIFRPKDDPDYVIIDLEFDNPDNAEKTLAALHKLWGDVEGKVMSNPKAQIINVVETIDY